MNPLQLIDWQWTNYRNFHQSRTNLLLHIVAVPVFLVANMALVLALLQGHWIRALVALLVMLVSFAAQAVGHSKEANPSIPFSSPANAFARIFIEQWINFPRYVLSGGWYGAFTPKDTTATSRVLPFPIQKVWGAFSNPESLAKWWGPNGFTNTFEKFEFETGGEWRFVMHGPDGANYPNSNVFQTIIEPTKVVIRHVVQPLFTLTVSLTEKVNGTEIMWMQSFDSPETYAAIRHIVEPANEQNLDRLTAVLVAA